MPELSPPARPLSAWMNVLDRIDQSIGQSLERTPEPAPLADPPEPAKTPLTRLDDQLAAWQARREAVEQHAATSDERLDAEHAALAQWLEKLGQVGDGVSHWLGAYPPS